MLFPMSTNRVVAAGFLALVLCAGALFGQERERPPDFQFILGPRIGVAYDFTSTEEFTDAVRTRYPDGTYVPVTSLFGIIAEQRILLGETNNHFAFQEVLLVGGLEQSIALPVASVLVGYRDASGFEFGVGPNLSFAGIGVIVAAGYTISFSGVFVPVDVSVVIPNANRPASVALTTGFNFVTQAVYSRR